MSIASPENQKLFNSQLEHTSVSLMVVVYVVISGITHQWRDISIGSSYDRSYIREFHISIGRPR